jgi:hypothetical protein
MPEYAQSFAENRSNFCVLSDLTDQYLKDKRVLLVDLWVEKLFVYQKLMKEVQYESYKIGFGHRMIGELGIKSFLTGLLNIL